MLTGKKVVIIGAAGLLGCTLVKLALAQGADVIAIDLNLEHIHQRLSEVGVDIKSKQLSFYQLDITDEGAVTKFFAQDIVIDGAVNCSYPRNKSYGAHFFDVSLASFNENLALHLGSTFLFNQQCASHFKQYGRKMSVVNISSIYGVVAPDFSVYEGTPMSTPVEYAAIKSSINHLNKYVTAYVKDSRFRVNSVSPGGLLDGQPQSFLDKYKDKTRGAGMLQSEDIVGAILFLLSDNSTYITGQNIIVDDGFHI